MESLANYGSDDEMDAPPSTNVGTDKDALQRGLEGDNYDDVQMEMSENPLNGSKAPSVQAHSLGCSGGALPTCATIPLDSGSESTNKDADDDNHSLHNSNHSSSSSSSPASAASSNDDESNEEESSPKLEEVQPQTNSITVDKTDEDTDPTDKEGDQNKRDLENRRAREKEREQDRDRDRDRERDRDRDRERERERDRDRDDKDRRKDVKRDDRHRSRSRDRKERRRSPERSNRRRSREREERQRTRDRRSSSRERRRKESDRRNSETNRRDADRKRHRSRSRSRDRDRRRPGADSRSSSSSGSSKSEARSKDAKLAPPGLNRGSRSRSKSAEKERSRPTGGDSRKFYLDKKIDRKMNVLERMGIELKAEAKSSIGTVTPQMLVQRTMEQQAAQVKQATGVELPSYYNAAAVNPQRLVDQIQKRKLLWGKKEDPNKPAAQQQPAPLNKWQGATFAQDQDGKLTAKFNRLMGIKAPAQASDPSGKECSGGSEIIKKQEEMFHNMENQYEAARLATHTHRGLGLGFGTFQPR